MTRLVALPLLLSAGCWFGDDAVAPPPVDAATVPEGCIAPEVRARTEVTVSGQVVDLTSGAPVAGAAVDVTTAWDVDGNLPPSVCPLAAQLTTDGAGRFGPVTVALGSTVSPPLVLFVVHGGDRAPTLSDARACTQATCNLGHTIAAPSRAQVDAWRTELAAGGMTAAAERGLVLFTYKNSDGTPAAGVTAQQGTLVLQPLTPGSQVRFVDAARDRLAAAGQATTTAAGMAVVGVDAPDHAVYVAGHRGADAWAGTGCLVPPGAVFVEDRTVSPP